MQLVFFCWASLYCFVFGIPIVVWIWMNCKTRCVIEKCQVQGMRNGVRPKRKHTTQSLLASALKFHMLKHRGNSLRTTVHSLCAMHTTYTQSHLTHIRGISVFCFVISYFAGAQGASEHKWLAILAHFWADCTQFYWFSLSIPDLRERERGNQISKFVTKSKVNTWKSKSISVDDWDNKIGSLSVLVYLLCTSKQVRLNWDSEREWVSVWESK